MGDANRLEAFKIDVLWVLKQVGWTQKKLAIYLNMTPATLSRYFNDKGYDFHPVRRLGMEKWVNSMTQELTAPKRK